ncbi:MAG: DUF58 domain-containing protein [Symbiobacteriia bacterium]
MFSALWSTLLVLLAMVALLAGRPLLFAGTFIALGVNLVIASWGRFGLRRVVLRRRINPDHVFPGEPVTLSLAIENHKLLPIPWLHLEEQIPDAAKVAKGRVGAHYLPRRARLLAGFQVGWHERVTQHYQVSFGQRGAYQFGPGRLTSGDVFGFATSHQDYPDVATLIVYPPLVPLEQLGLPSALPLGGARSHQSMEMDPTSIVGVRAYDPRDDFRDVHWYATARLGELQTKVYEPTLDQSVAVFLNVATYDPAWSGQQGEWLETAVTTAAAVLNDCAQRRIPSGLYSNGHLLGEGLVLRMPVSASAGFLPAALEALARLVAPPSIAFEAVWAEEALRLPLGTTVVFITAVATGGFLRAVNEAALRHPVVALLVGEASLPPPPGVAAYHVTWGGDADDAVRVAGFQS